MSENVCELLVQKNYKDYVDDYILCSRRALLQRCDKAKVRNLISLGGQHQGVYGLPKCGSLSNSTCDYIRKLLNHAAYVG